MIFQVEVLTGKDKGTQGEVVSVIKKQNRLIVEGVNMVSRHYAKFREGVLMYVHVTEKVR